MKAYPTLAVPRRFVPNVLCLALLLVAGGPIDFTPSAEAATSAERRKTRVLQTKFRKLARANRKLRRELAAALLPAPAAPFIEMVTVGNPGNANDPEDGNFNNWGVKQNFGAVVDTFQIGKYEVTNKQYAEFLNAVAADDANELFNTNMESSARGGIRQFGTSPNFHYAAKAGMEDKPVIFVNFWDACRFCNWLHNGMPAGAQDATTTEAGAYDLTVQQKIDDNEVVRSAGAKFFLPTEDQWYKAAYHEPGGDTDSYWLYPTRSNDPPTVATVDGIGEITNGDGSPIANFNSGADWDSDDDGSVENGNVTSVGSGGPGNASFYGACDMGGNVWEWNETIILDPYGPNSGSYRGWRGGSWFSSQNNLRSSFRSLDNPLGGGNGVGFRVASP